MYLWPPHVKPPACSGCPRASRGRGFVPGEIVPGARLAVVGEQPGENEVIEGRPFVGKSGFVLGDGLGGKEGRASTSVTNVRKCLGAKGESEADRDASIAHCAAAYLQAELDAAAPAVICAVGADSSGLLAGRADVSVVTGSVWSRNEAEALAEANEVPF